MPSPLRRLGITVALLGLSSVPPATVGAQPPIYLTQWGSEGVGDGQFIAPVGVATDAAGSVYVVDYGNNRIQKFSSTGAYLAQWGSLGIGEGQFNSPFGVATDAAGAVYVAEINNRRVQKFSSSGGFLTQWGSPPDSLHRLFVASYAVATDAAGAVYVVDYGGHNVQKFTNTGLHLTQWGSFGSGNGEFDSPIAAATDAAGNVYVVEFQNHRVQKFTSTGGYVTQWGTFGSGDGQFANPAGVATDAAGNVYVADFGNHRIQKFTGTGVYLTQWGSVGTGDGQFIVPRGVATDAAGNIYVADQGNNRIQKFGSSTPTIAMSFEVTPLTLSTSSRGLWVTGVLEPATPFAASDIDIASIRLNGVVGVSASAPSQIGDHDGDGVPDLTVRFNRSSVALALPEGTTVALTVTGTLGGSSFVGTGQIRVIHAPASAAQAASGLATPDPYDLPPIDGPLGAQDHGPAAFGLRVANPARNHLQVSFSLGGSQAASLTLFDVSGRQISARRVDGMGPGWHTVTLGERGHLTAGVYIVRLTQDGRSLSTRAAVVQ